MLKLSAADIGRPVADIGLDLSGTDLESVIAQVLHTANARQVQATDRLGNSCLLHVRLGAWREAGISTLVVQTKQKEALAVMAELLL